MMQNSLERKIWLCTALIALTGTITAESLYGRAGSNWQPSSFEEEVSTDFYEESSNDSHMIGSKDGWKTLICCFWLV